MALSNDYAQVNLGPGAKWVKKLTQDRLNTFTGGHFASVNLTSVLFTKRLDDEKHVQLQVWSAPGQTKPSFKDAMRQKFRPVKKGESFGPSWTNHWWKATIYIPSSFAEYERVQFEFDPGCEAMIFAKDGTPLQAITGGFGGDRRVEHIIPAEAREKGIHEIIIESSCNGMFGVPQGGDTISPPDMNRYFQLASADLVVPNQEAWRLMWDFETLKQIVQTLPGTSPIQNKALNVANGIMNNFDNRDPSTIAKCRKIAEQVFGDDWESKGADIYDEGPPKVDRKVWGIGHCHIDSAWLWPFRVTQQKVARSWSTQVDLMERFPEHRFAASSAQQWKWLETLYPKGFEKVKEKVLSGQFHPIGGNWVENDGNMPSGEALSRQLLFGQRYFESRFGKRCETAWLPDSFGYNGGFPQIMRNAGMKYFFTQKLSWNNINVFPHSTFNWVGIDGTQILCHMTPVDTYTAQATVGDVTKALNNHKNLESTDHSLLVFGNGDGGGGPLPPMLENLRRIRAAANESRDLPVVHMGRSVDEFFHYLEKTTNEGKALPVWHGELYFEYHRGTLTSHGSIKLGNRRSEVTMQSVEFFATLASLYKGDYVYPRERINENWEKLLLNQFHDVLPGSSIGMVYDDAEKAYAEIAESCKSLLKEAFEALSPKSALVSQTEPYKIPESGGRIVAYSSLDSPRCEIVQVPLGNPGAGRIRSESVQIAKDGKYAYLLMDGSGITHAAVPRGLYANVTPVFATTDGNGSFCLTNSNVQLTISNGRITSLLDVALDRELIPKGQTGGLVWFVDRPNYWDAWDVEIHHLEMPHELRFENVKIVENGPVRATISADASYDKSTIKLLISLDAIPATTKSDARSSVTFDATIDWHQRHELLKFQIPLNIHSDNATYECPFGYVQRPTHKNTTIDMAKFEVCGHKYADLSEYGYGVAILTSSKYGYSCLGNVLSVSLLRAATSPDAEQDQGVHRIGWAVLPHVGHFLQSDVPHAARLFNSPLYVQHTLSEVPEALADPPFVVLGAPNVILDTIKRGEDDDLAPQHKAKTAVILRLYEAYGGHARAILRVSKKLSVRRAYLSNILEDSLVPIEPLECTDGAQLYEINFWGFQVQTVKLILGPTSSDARERSRDSWVDVNRFLGTR